MNFYTRQEASVILQVTPYTISNYIKKGILKNYGSIKTIKLSCEEVHSFYQNVKHSSDKVSKSDVLRLEHKVETLSSELEVLKLLLGVGASKKAKNDEELQVLHMEIMRLLTNKSWSTKEILYIADLMISLRDSEVLRSMQMKGTRSWTALFDLSERMLKFIKGLPNLPATTKNVLDNRLEAGRSRMYGLIYISLSEHIGLERSWAKKLAGSRIVDPTTDEFLINYLAKRKI